MAKGLIDKQEFMMDLGYTNFQSRIVFGDHHENSTTENATWIPLIDSNYWSVALHNVLYNNQSLRLSSSRGIIDSGTSLLVAPSSTQEKRDSCR